MQILKFSPIMWIMLFVIAFTRYFATVSPSLSDSFKLWYNIVCFALMYGLIAFETWSLDYDNTDWKQKYKDKGVAKK